MLQLNQQGKAFWELLHDVENVVDAKLGKFNVDHLVEVLVDLAQSLGKRLMIGLRGADLLHGLQIIVQECVKVEFALIINRDIVVDVALLVGDVGLYVLR